MRPYTVASDAGNRRASNEDSYAVDPELGLWVVADGLGGHQSGEIASSIACEIILANVRSGETLTGAIVLAHEKVLQAIATDSATNNMGTTVVALKIEGNSYEIAWVGDSRAYVFDDGLKLLTRDHSAVNDLVDSGIISPEEAREHPQRHVLSRSLGVSSSIASKADSVSGIFDQSCQMLLCTDGLTDELSDVEIENQLRAHHSPKAQADALVAAALAKGGRDNVTLIIVGDAVD